MPTLSNELDPKLDPLIETIMQCGFEVAMGGNPFEPYDQELAFEKARATCRKALRKLIATQNTALLKELLEQQELVIEHSADFNDMKQYYAVPVPVINSKLAAMGEQ